MTAAEVEAMLEPRVPFTAVARAIPCTPATLEKICEEMSIPIYQVTAKKRSLTQEHAKQVLTRTRSAA